MICFFFRDFYLFSSLKSLPLSYFFFFRATYKETSIFHFDIYADNLMLSSNNLGLLNIHFIGTVILTTFFFMTMKLSFSFQNHFKKTSLKSYQIRGCNRDSSAVQAGDESSKKSLLLVEREFLFARCMW